MRTFQGAYTLSEAERASLTVALQRARSGQSVVHPTGRPCTPPPRDFSFTTTHWYPHTYPSVGSRIIEDRSP